MNAKIDGKPATEVITDHAWLKGDFIAGVQQRGAAVIKARGASSAASAGNACIDTVKSLIRPTPPAVASAPRCAATAAYGIESGLICGFPLTSDGKQMASQAGLPDRRLQPRPDRQDRRRTEAGTGHGEGFAAVSTIHSERGP